MTSLLPYEPSNLEIALTLGLGLTVLSGYYNGYAHGLELTGGERVLDFGAGSGVCSRHIAAVLQPSGGRLECVDASARWQRVIRRTLRRFDNVGFHNGQLAGLNLPPASFDAVVIHFVLHDIPTGERPALLAGLSRLLKRDGRLLVREPLGRGLEEAELTALTAAVGLRQTSLEQRRTLAGQVCDGCFVA